MIVFLILCALFHVIFTFCCSARRPNIVLNAVKITHMDSQTSDSDRSNTQMMLPDVFLSISSHFVKFCDFSKKSKLFKFSTPYPTLES